MPRITYYPHSVRAKRPGTIEDVPWAEFAEYLESRATNVRQKGASGYWVAAACRGPHADAACEPTDVVALDWEADTPPGDWPGFIVAHTTDSHSADSPRWRVWVRLDRAYSAEELRRIVNPWPDGVALRAISQPAFVPTMGEDIWWLDYGRHENAWTPDLAPAVSEAPAPPRPAPAGRTNPSRASINALVTRWLSDPAGTNRLAGATGACLAEWGWSDADIEAFIAAWLHADPKLAKHTDDALRAAAKRRAGDRIVGFPTLVAELGGEWAAERPAELGAAELLALASASADSPAASPADAAGGGAEWCGARVLSAADVCATAVAEPNWLVRALVMAPGAPSLITGYGGSGKTTFVQHLAIAVATPGVRLLGAYEVRHGSVLHIDQEQGHDTTLRRYQRLGLTPAAQLDLVVFPQWSLADADADAQRALVRAARGRALVIIDSFRASCAAFLEDENSSDARAPLDVLTRISDATGCVFLIIHHSKKDRSDRMVSARGASAITDAVSLHLTYEKAAHGPQERPVLAIGKTRHEYPAGALDGELEVAMAPRPDRGVIGGYDLVGVDASAVASAAAAKVGEEVVSLLATGWEGSKSALVRELKRDRRAVYAALKELTQNGIIEDSGRGVRLVTNNSVMTQSAHRG